MKILIVDDSAEDRSMTVRLLAQDFADVEADEISDSQGLADALEKGGYAAVITDYRMRWTDGLRVLKEVKSRWKDCPVIFFTSGGSEEIALEAMRAGADDYVTKKVNLISRLPRALRYSIERATVKRRLSDALRQQEALYRFVERRHQAKSLDEMCDAALDAILAALPCRRSAILLADASGRMRFIRWRGLSEDYRKAVEGRSPWPPEDRNPQPVCIGDLPAAELDESLKAFAAREGIGATGLIPVVVNGKLAGKFVICYDAPHQFDEEEIDLSLTLARQLALGIERKQADEALKEANRRKDEFLAMLGHELRNPLSVISNSVQVLRLIGGADPEIREWREIMQRQVDQMVRILDDLLDVSRISRGRIQIRNDRCDLSAIVRATAEDYRTILQTANLRLEVDVPEGPVWLSGDAVRLAQAFGNLLQNAGKFTESGGGVTVKLAAQDNNKAVLTVHDTGMGIEPEILSWIFEPFSQAEKGLYRTRGGLGLGLSLVKGIVELHGGDVEARSDGAGRGSTFTVRLPRTPMEPTAAVEPVPANRGNRRLRILIIEDNPATAQTTRVLLEESGHTLDLAYTGVAGVELARQFRPEVVLCDIGLPEMDGYAVARTLREQTELRNVYLIAVSGYAPNQERVRESGFDAYLTKPLNFEKLEAMLAKFAAGSAARDSQQVALPLR